LTSRKTIGKKNMTTKERRKKEALVNHNVKKGKIRNKRGKNPLGGEKARDSGTGVLQVVCSEGGGGKKNFR